MKTRRFGKKVFAAFIISALLCMAVPFGALAAGTEPPVDPTDNNTYLISTPAQLEWVSDQSVGTPANTFAGKTIKLAADIDLSSYSSWTPIKGFAGTFDGNEKTISNLNITGSSDNAGLFGDIKGNPEFKDVTVSGANITGGSYVGGIIGNAFTTKGITNCHVVESSITGTNFVGGIAGSGYVKITNCTVEDTTVKSSVSGFNRDSGDNIGGILGFAGENTGATIVTNCKAVNVNVSGVRKVAGIVGTVLYGTEITNCTVQGGTIQGTLPFNIATLTVSTGGIGGQLVGGTDEAIVITNCIVDTATVLKPANNSRVNWLVGDTETRLGSTPFTSTDNQYISITQ